MEVCRICLSGAPDKHISQLKTSKKYGDKNYLDIMPFCLDIQISENCEITKKLCTKCFKKILTFYKFKATALKNDAYLKCLIPESNFKLKLEPMQEVEVTADHLSDHDDYKNEIKYELESNARLENEFATEVTNLDVVKTEVFNESDDEVLISVIKQAKESYNPSYNEDYQLPDVTTNQTVLSNTKTKPNRRKTTLKPVKKQSHHIGEPGVCHQCGANVQNLRLHSLVHVPRHNRRRFPCQQCDKVFITSASLSVHRKIKHFGKLGHCDICNRDYVCLKKHQLSMHNKEAMKVQCEICHERFLYQSKLDVHMTHHTKEKAHQCHRCGKSFRIKLLLQQHVRAVHELEKNFVCQHCSKSFFKKYHFINHLRTHTKEKPFKCPSCEKCFATSTHLKNHQYSHRTVKDFHCQLCTMSFIRPGNLRTHMLSHSSEKKFPCRYCGVGFKRSNPRKKHEFEKHEKSMSVHGESVQLNTSQ